MSFQLLPHTLPMDKLFLDVRLEAVPLLDNNVVDLTGGRTFTVGMMRKNKGFGITDIQIETKASLQPIVEITFKDLYGNTVFENLNYADNTKDKLNYSLLFDWPPPKFRFTFKGYLGKSVTWIMNLKKTTTRYGSNDGSYEIKASFVPNSWGFLADIPFLYLLAKKRLKRDLTGTEGSNPNKDAKNNKIESIFDIIKIGKTIETKTKQVTKEFDKLQKQLSILKANAIDGLINKDFEPNDTIDGKVSGRQPIKGVKNVSGQNDLPDFTSIKITLPPSLSKDVGDSIKFQETLKSLKSDAQLAEHRKIIALIGGASTSGMETLGKTPTDAKAFQNSVNAGIKIIDNDLKLIDVETKRRLFETSETQLGAVTISEVFSRLSADGAFILGSILDAGYKGFSDNQGVRNENKLNGKPLIGRYFPLTINPDSGEQVPATDAGIENDGCEMSFVRRFLTAISEGIAENQASQNQDALNSTEGKLTARINNLEVINPNPYLDASGKQLLETILIRSGIAAYITRSFDPNQPGDYNTSYLSTKLDNDVTDDIKNLADKELKNITDEILSSLSSEDYSYVKSFCKFINNLFDVDGENLMTAAGPKEVGDFGSIDEIKNLTVYAKAATEDQSLGTVDSIFKQFISPTSIFYQGNPKGNSDSINYDTFTAGYLYNNNTLWTIPQIGEKYTYVFFNKTTDKSALDSVQNNETDSEFNNTDKQETSEPLGIVKITNGKAGEEQNPDEYKRLEVLNERISIGAVLDYSKLKDLNLNVSQLQNINGVYYVMPSQLNNGKNIFVEQPINELNIGNGVVYTVYSHVTSDDEPYLTWSLFRPSSTGGDVRGRNQRIFLRKICTDIEKRMSKLEDEKNNVLSQVLGKAQSNENSLYIQMHHIFHQWGVLGFSMDNSSANTNKNSNGSSKPTDQPITAGKIAETLEKEYGTIVTQVQNGQITGHSVEETETASAGAIVSSTGFRYDFPMEKMMNPPPAIPTVVGNSIINIEPLYKPNANTTLLNIIQQLCTKNNFMFVPIPGNVDYTNINEIFSPSIDMNPKIGNIFHVLFTPTPENRARENDGTPLSLRQDKPPESLDAFEIEFGSPDNAIIKNLDVSTEESRPTAESILNLQRLVDKDNSNKVVTTDCSILSVMEGRSYKMKVDMIGNAQISPMQYFYVSRMPIFSGLYQVMNVTHSIKPNDMTTTLEGIKMRFDTTSRIRGIGPITLESLKALGSPSGTEGGGSVVNQPNVGSSSPALPTQEKLSELPNPVVSSVSNSELDLIPGTYLNNDKKPITLVQIDGVPVEINTAKAYLVMKKAAAKDGISLRVSSCFRPQYGDGVNTVSFKGVKVKASSQESLRRQYLKKQYPNPDSVPNPQGKNVTVLSDTLKPQSKYFDPLVSHPGDSTHGNGVAMDLNTGSRHIDGKNMNISIMTPEKEKIYIWLVKNGWKYGFVRTVPTEEWHFDYRPDWAKLGPYGGFIGKGQVPVSTIEQRNKVYFFTDFGLSNLTI